MGACLIFCAGPWELIVACASMVCERSGGICIGCPVIVCDLPGGGAAPNMLEKAASRW